MIGKLFRYSQYNKHRKDLPAKNAAFYIKVTVSLKALISLDFIDFTGYTGLNDICIKIGGFFT